jgi:hypothetical protein
MVKSAVTTVEAYLDSLPDDRRQALSAVRAVILDNLPGGYEEAMQWGMISYIISLSRYPNTYNGQALSIAALASQKNYMSLYLMCVYGHKPTEEWFRREFAASGKKLDMGKSCVHFRKLEDLPLDVIGQTIARVPVEAFLRVYEESRHRK